MRDIVIIGAGPAGLTAGIYAARAGLSTLLLEKAFPGGQIAKTAQLENFPGFPGGISGPDFCEALRRQAEEQGVSFRMAEVTKIDPKRRSVYADGEEIEAKTIILALGAQPRSLEIPGEAELTGAGVSYCATCDGAFFRGREVAIVGGGDTALEDALYLGNLAKKVYLIHRRDTFRAGKVLVDRAADHEKIEFLLDTVPVRFLGKLDFEGMEVKNVKTGDLSTLTVEGCFIAAGNTPDTAWLKDTVALDASGYIVAGEDTKTSVPGIFAAGDARAKRLRQVVTAAADGAVAATMAQEYILSHD